MDQRLEHILKDFQTALTGVATVSDLDNLETAYLGRKSGQLTAVMKEIKQIPKDEVAAFGAAVNELKQRIVTELAERREELLGAAGGEYDVTLPGISIGRGHLHPVTIAIEEITRIFDHIGFERIRTPEVDWDYYAFEALNMPPDHPARDEWETFFIDRQPIGQLGQRVLIPHTTSGQARELEQSEPPIRIVNIGKCYRRQIDASHTPMFHQFDGLCVDQGINITHLKGVLDYFVKSFFGPERETRLRPYHFQFTEPSFEIDISCGVCAGAGCKLCKQGWLELGGAGMVHPNVLKAGNIDPSRYSGFAFGWGVERTYLMKSGMNIDDLRLLYKNDIRFMEQF